jgi:hypothetical protein
MSWRNETCGNWSCNNSKSNKKSGFCKNHYEVYKDLIYSGMDHNEADMCVGSDDSHNYPQQCRLSKWSEGEMIKGWNPRDHCNHKMARGIGLCNKHLLMCSRHCHETNINILEFIDTKESEVNKSVSEAENAHAEKEEVWMRQYAEKRAREEASKREETRKATEKARAREADRKATEKERRPERYGCEYGCGFEGVWALCHRHEKTCMLRPAADVTEKERAREEDRKATEEDRKATEEDRKATEKERAREEDRKAREEASKRNNTSEYYTDPDGIRVSGGPRVDPEIARKQKERVQELRRVQMKKESDAREMAEVQKRVDREVDRWSQSKDLLTMLRTFNHILPGFPVIQMDCSVKKAYMNALRMVHPDKIDQNASVETKATAQRVFTKLRENKP